MPATTTPPQTVPKPPSAIKAAQAVIDRLKQSPAPTLAQLGELINEAMKDRRPQPGVCHCADCMAQLAKHGESKLAKANRERTEREQAAAQLPALP